ncbi:MAG: citrate/2-methylcitrate synthase [bacterium]|nr:citrate/2-methylcitrate synthase [bacterium]
MNVVSYITSLVPGAMAFRRLQVEGGNGDEVVASVSRRAAWNGLAGARVVVSSVPGSPHRVDSKMGLIVSGYPMADFADDSFEANYIRLLTGKSFLGEEALLYELTVDLRNRMLIAAVNFLDSADYKAIYHIMIGMGSIRGVHPLDMITAAILSLEGHSRVQQKLESDAQHLLTVEDVLEDYIDIQGLMLVLVPMAWRIFNKAPVGDLPRLDRDISYARNLAVSLIPNEELVGQGEKVLNLLLYLMAYHGAGNASTFVGLITTGAFTNPYGDFVAMSKALKGVNHGGAAEMGTRMLFRLAEEFDGTFTDDDFYRYAIERLRSGASGFCVGHRIITGEDPRARLQSAMLKREFPDSVVMDLAGVWYRNLPKAVQDVCGGDLRVVNVDAYTGVSLIELGIIANPQQSGFSTLLFQIARTCGLATESFWAYLTPDRSGRARVKPALIRPAAVPPTAA